MNQLARPVTWSLASSTSQSPHTVPRRSVSSRTRSSTPSRRVTGDRRSVHGPPETPSAFLPSTGPQLAELAVGVWRSGRDTQPV